MHKSQIFILLLVSFLVGVFVGQFLDPQSVRILLYLALVLAAMGITIFWGSARVGLICGLIVCFALGAWRLADLQTASSGRQIAAFNEQGKIVWQGTVVEEPDVRGDKINLVVQAERLREPEERPISGRVLVTAPRYPEYQYGDVLVVSGKLRTPGETPEFSYRQYLAGKDIYSLSSFAEIEVSATHKGNPVVGWLLDFKARFIAALSLLVAEPENSLLAGLLVGAKKALSQELTDLFKVTGLSHIIAVSGYNISIITSILGGAVQKRLGIKAAFVACLLAVVGLVVITGAQASVVRAAIMGMLVVIALNLGRMTAASSALVLAAAAMVAISPKILLSDVGFQLSFLATLGLVTFGTALENSLKFLPEFLEIRKIGAATLSAQLFVMPLLLYNFGQLSLISPLANLFVLPAIPWAMFFGFVTGLAALIWLPLGYLTAWLTWLLLHYQLAAIRFFGGLPFAALAIPQMPVSWLASYYALLALAAFVLLVRQREKRIAEFNAPID